MSGTRTSPTLDTEDLLGRDPLGDAETARLNQALNNLAQGLGESDEPVDELVAALEQAAEDVAIAFDQLRQDLASAADAAEDALQELLAAIEDALSDAGIIDGNGNGDEDDGDNGNGDGNGDGTNGDGVAAKTAFALLLPANNSGALGFAAVRLDGNTLDVSFVADNVTLGEPHPLHIHGFADDRTARLAVAGDDADGDGFVETAEGAAAAFGPIIASLTASGAVDPALGASDDFDVADADGRIVFNRSYTLDPDAGDGDDPLSALQSRLEGRIIKLHGLEVAEGAGEGTPGEVNGDGGYAALLPIAAGPLLFLPDEVAAQFAAEPEALLDGITAFLDALAPFTLKVDGSGAIAPDPLLSDEAGLAGARDTDNGDDNGANGNGDTNGTNGNGADGDANGALRFVSLILPANNSGVFGAASITFDEDAGSVAIEMNLAGLEPGRAHAMHIHGFADDRASLIPNITLDADLDGFVEASEGGSVVGPVLLGLTGDGSITDASLIGAWPEADANGFLSLRQTYRFDLDDPAESALFGEFEDRMEGRLIQVHGLTVDAAQGEDTRGEVAGEGGFQPLLPIAHGAILSTETEGGAFAAVFVDLLQAALEAQASSDDTTPTASAFQDALIA